MSQRGTGRVSEPQTAFSVLVASCFDEDHIAIRQILRGPNWKLVSVFTCQEALKLLSEQRFDAIVCERELPGGNWRAVLDRVSNCLGMPHVIVSSRQADERMWAEVLNLGGYDVLPTPFEGTEVSRVVHLACSHRLREPLYGLGPRELAAQDFSSNA